MIVPKCGSLLLREMKGIETNFSKINNLWKFCSLLLREMKGIETAYISNLRGRCRFVPCSFGR
ncbi:Uncharacterized protein dnm_080380 [Desulfonema magnum]|uniref:Uncharacterized protein n=1 Tax=Desulfonema magnum TaxID=45655 RepID=A0A975GSE1_9BACT|nr:Uncharacterized protein dnm_080380 [Desulfonema magnum]